MRKHGSGWPLLCDFFRQRVGAKSGGWPGGAGMGLETRRQKVEWERAGGRGELETRRRKRERGRSMLRPYKTKALGGASREA